MDPDFWLDRWEKNQIGFHAPRVQPALAKHWPRLDLKPGGTILVPLAGKSLDMWWLAEQGFRVIGVELSPVAIDAFFNERGIVADVRKFGAFTVHSAGAIELWCGDFFALEAQVLPPIGALYDRAALVAMPPEMQPAYAGKLAELMPINTTALLIGLDYNREEMSGPPFAIPQAEVRALFGLHFTVDMLDVRDGLTSSEHLRQRGITRLEEATYLLRRRA